jgi:uncharacterized protein YqhQ
MKEQKLPSYGGQAVIEGVMMRGRRGCAVAVRSPDQSIVIEPIELGSFYQSKYARIPFIRGLLLLWDALTLGTKALSISANIQAPDESERIEGTQLKLTMLGSLLIGLLIFVVLPAGAAYVVDLLLDLPLWTANIIEGVFRLSILIVYIWGIGRLEDIQRVYGYHGAEHKTINAFEDGAELTPQTVALYPREHPRCGTAFLLTVVVFSVLIFSLLGPMPLIQRLASRILLIPLVASISYEYIRLTARWLKYPIGRILLWPNLALQRLTTREPDSEMLEVGIASFQAMQELETVAPQASIDPA